MIPAKIPWSNKMILILKKVLASDLCKNLSQLDHRKHEMNFFNITGLERNFFTYLRNDINDPTFLHMEKGLFWPVVTCDKAFLFFRAREVRWMKNSKFENKKQKRQQQKKYKLHRLLPLLFLLLSTLRQSYHQLVSTVCQVASLNFANSEWFKL